ncbi:copper chaperone PCu(A)C [Azospirillum halopraeferens]|uniref:copper chaperone PCu(A)C n=1 Tax=Azospirillum halopraeferens TaxID=34010 RepID=UPI0004242DE3|nr:copper chaperone PCu(A)C [Azospirillum halopraeferens]
MKTLFAAALVAALAAAAPALAQGGHGHPAPAAAPAASGAPAATVGTIAIVAPWARATAPNARVGGTYMTLTNDGEAVDRLVAASSPVAEKVELHTHLMDNGVMRMRPVDGIEVAPGEPSVLRPGGLHVMLIGLKQPLAQGSRFPLTLTFETAGAVTLDVPVQAAGAMSPDGHAMPQPAH